MDERSWLLVVGLLLLTAWPVHAQVIRGVMSVTGAEMD
jgi:hypothetical protein